MSQHIATRRNRVAKRAQYVVPNNIAILKIWHFSKHFSLLYYFSTVSRITRVFLLNPTEYCDMLRWYAGQGLKNWSNFSCNIWGKLNKWRAGFLASAIKIESRTSRRYRIKMQSASNNRRRFWIWVAFYYHFFPKNIIILPPVRSCWFLHGSFILSFSLKDVSHSAPPNCLLSNPLHSRRFHCTTIQHYFCCWSPHSELLFCWVIF